MCALALIYEGAQISVKNKDGNTPLHVAVGEASEGEPTPWYWKIWNYWQGIYHAVDLVEALLVFDADTTETNGEGLTPWKLAMNKWREAKASHKEHVEKEYEDILFALHEVGAQDAEEDTDELGFLKEMRQKRQDKEEEIRDAIQYT